MLGAYKTVENWEGTMIDRTGEMRLSSAGLLLLLAAAAMTLFADFGPRPSAGAQAESSFYGLHR